MKVAILGAGGTIAPAIVRDLAESDEVSKLLLLDIDERRAAEVAERHGGGKARAAKADARAGAADPGSVARAIDRYDVLVNSASYRINLDAMRACLAAECHYLDLGGLYWMTGRQLELAPEFERAGLLALLGMGSAPGKTNLMAAQAVAALGGRVEGIDISCAGRDSKPPEGFSVPYSLQTLLDELKMRPVVVRDAHATEIDPMAGAGAVDFGPPIGEAGTIYTLHSEMRTFPGSFGCREASFRLSLAPQLLERLRELRDASPERIARVAVEALPPSPFTRSVHLVEAAGGGRIARVRCLTEPIEKWRLGGGVVSTATPAAAAVRMLARGEIDARGVLPPESALDPQRVFAELEQRGSSFEIDVGAVGDPAAPGSEAEQAAGSEVRA